MKLLAVLAELKQLQHLHLHHSLPLQLTADKPHAAIKASSQLTYLDPFLCYIISSAAWNVLTPGRCGKLVELHVSPPLLESPGSFELLAKCCPALQYLEIEKGYHFVHRGFTDEKVACTLCTCTVYLRYL